MKNLNLILIAVSAVLLSACDYNEKNFPGFDGYKPTDVKTMDYTLTDADYKTIATNAINKAIAKENGDSIELAGLTSAKMFNPTLAAADYIPAFLAATFPSFDVGSAIRVTYNYKSGSAGFYTLTANDYTQIWDGVSTVGALTPSKSPSATLPTLLAAKYPAAKEGDVKVVEYQYSATEPGQNETLMPLLEENFESFTSGGGFAYMSTQPDSKGWKGFATGAGTLEPDVRSFNNNLYVQFSAHRSSGVTAGDEQEMWLVSPPVNVPQNTTTLKFDMAGGYFNATTVFKVYVMDSDDPATATKTELTGWKIPVVADIVSGSYTPFISSGVIDITAFKGAKYIGFYYYGFSGSGNSTTYQLDNFDVSYIDVSAVVPTKETRFAYAKFVSGVWTLDNAKSIYQLTADDYAAMGKTTLAAADAPKYLPTLLRLKYPYAQQGDTKVVIYKTSATADYADEYVFQNGAWAPVSFVEARTSQFIKADNGKWIFDPTVNYTMVTADYKIMVDYIIANKPEFNELTHNYNNEEFYYGFSSRYSNISLRLSYRDAYLQYDPELAAATTTDEKAAILWKRLEEGIGIFLQLKFPEAQAEVQGVPIYYNLTAKVYSIHGTETASTDAFYYTWKYKVVTAGTPTTPAVFEYVSLNPPSPYSGGAQ